VNNYEREVAKNKSTYWLIFELMFRDFFRLIAIKHRNKLFFAGGCCNIKRLWKQGPLADEAFERWKV
jgi:deoxyribodipyrimidine photo-lyase